MALELQTALSDLASRVYLPAAGPSGHEDQRPPELATYNVLDRCADRQRESERAACASTGAHAASNVGPPLERLGERTVAPAGVAAAVALGRRARHKDGGRALLTRVDVVVTGTPVMTAVTRPAAAPPGRKCRPAPDRARTLPLASGTVDLSGTSPAWTDTRRRAQRERRRDIASTRRPELGGTGSPSGHRLQVVLAGVAALDHRPAGIEVNENVGGLVRSHIDVG